MGQNMDIVISTPMGNMDAKANFTINAGVISGIINFMGSENTFQGGSIDANGKINFSGSFNSPVGKIDYDISGTLLANKLDAVANTKMGKLTIKSK